MLHSVAASYRLGDASFQVVPCADLARRYVDGISTRYVFATQKLDMICGANLDMLALPRGKANERGRVCCAAHK